MFKTFTTINFCLNLKKRLNYDLITVEMTLVTITCAHLYGSLYDYDTLATPVNAIQLQIK